MGDKIKVQIQKVFVHSLWNCTGGMNAILARDIPLTVDDDDVREPPKPKNWIENLDWIGSGDCVHQHIINIIFF